MNDKSFHPTEPPIEAVQRSVPPPSATEVVRAITLNGPTWGGELLERYVTARIAQALATWAQK